MDKLHRTGNDIAVSFRALASKEALREAGAAPFDVSAPVAGTIQGDTAAAAFAHSNILRRAARKCARLAFSLLKPVLRPLAYRLRRYLIDGLRSEMAMSQDQLRQSLYQFRMESGEYWHAARDQEQHALSRLIQQMQALQVDFRRRIDTQSSALTQRLDLAEENFQRLILDAWEKVDNSNRSSSEAHHAQLARIESYALTSARRAALNLGQQELLVRTAVGYMLCDATDPALVVQLFDAGELEPGTRLLIESILKPGKTFLDVGANIGMHTIAAARAMEGHGRILAFEPFKRTCHLLAQSVWLNGFGAIIAIHNVAVSSKEGIQKLFLGGTSGHHSLYPLGNTPGAVGNTVEVKVVRLDDVVAAGMRIDLIKIDVEGAELDVLEGAQRIIKENPSVALIVEFGPSHINRLGHSVDLWLQAFGELGFNYQVINPVTGQLEQWGEEQLKQVDSVNLYFSKDIETISDIGHLAGEKAHG